MLLDWRDAEASEAAMLAARKAVNERETLMQERRTLRNKEMMRRFPLPDPHTS
jgi:hypothetical protein